MYVDAEKTNGIVFNYLVSNRYDAGSLLPIRLKGLDPQKRYTIKELHVTPLSHCPGAYRQY